MRTRYQNGVIKLLELILVLLLLSGCGISVTQESAQQALDGAHVAIEAAKGTDAQTYSPDNLKKAERLLDEAEDALSRNRRQRAYTLATRAAEAAKLAEDIAKQNLEGIYPDSQVPQADKKVFTEISAHRDTMAESTLSPTDEKISPSKPAIPSQPETEYTSTAIPEKTGAPMSDVQSRIKAAIQALEEAQNAVMAARLLMFKTQAEIGLSMADATIQQARQNGAPTEVVNLMQSLYDQAKKDATAGKYEEAVSSIERAQTYAQAFIKSVISEK